ncbi:MAG TPA: enoyl-CoA hydratase-related protein [Armatimonadota bacterium]
MDGYRNLIVDLDAAGTLSISLNRPEAQNAINGAMIQELLAAMEQASQRKGIRMVVFRGEGPVFCGGLDTQWTQEMGSADHLTNLNDAKTFARMLDLVDVFPRPVVAELHGSVVGDALGLVCACDSAVASAETVFQLPHLRYGIVPSCVAPYLIAKTGGSHARHLMLTGRPIDAQRAREIRLIHDIVPRAGDLAAATECLAADLRLAAPVALKTCKRLIRRLTYHGHSLLTADTLEDIAQCLSENRTGAEVKEGLEAAAANRPPAWTT